MLVKKLDQTEVLIRQMKEEDIHDVYDIERKSFPFPFGETLISNIFYSSPELCYIVQYQDKIVGFLLGGYTSLPEQAHILSLAIEPRYRLRGFAKSLLTDFLRRTKNIGYKSIKLEVDINNHSAIKLYEDLGFQIISKIRKYYQDNSDAYLMVKNID